MSPTVGLIGLGNMGRPMALTLRRAGLEVLGHDLVPERRRALADDIDIATDAAELCRRCSVVLLSLPGSPQVEALVHEAFLPHALSGSLLIDTSTADPDSSRRLHAELAAAGHAMLDAPVSGGAAGAEAGQLLVMAGGSVDALERARPVLEPLAARVVHCGGPGAGHTVKLINNLLCAAHLDLVGEALALADAADIAPDDLLAALNAGSGRSAVSEVHVPRWVLSGSFDSGFSMGLMRKDLSLAAGLIERTGADTVLGRTALRRWREDSAALDDGLDFTRLVQWAREAAHGQD